MTDAKFDITLVGGGIIGLATALAACKSLRNLRILVLEKEREVGSHQTGHNSGVIHSGVYYRPGSLKANNCVLGAARMIEFCKMHEIPHEICGKVIVATKAEEVAGLQELHRRGVANGVTGLKLIGPERLRELEPYCAGVSALHVPSTGITNFLVVARKYAEIITSLGGRIETASAVTGILRNGQEVLLETNAGTFQSRFVINCAGLQSDRLMKMAGDQRDLQIVPFRGEYYQLAPHRSSLVRSLIYPVPDPNLPFLGVHFTKKVNGSVEAGPNAVLAWKREGYRKSDVSIFDLAETLKFVGFWRMARKQWKNALSEYCRSVNKAAFTRSLQKLVPELKESDLIAGGAGVRAQALASNGKLIDDFEFVDSQNIVHVCNVPSPAATSSLVIGESILNRVLRNHSFE